MNNFTIEKGVPIPPAPIGGRGRRPFYPFHEMEVGDSFIIEGDRKDQERAGKSAYRFGRRNSQHFTVEMAPDGLSARIWRTS